MTDAALSAFSVFFTQSPSFLDWQTRMQKSQGRNNANTLFGVYQIPTHQQICNLLDDTPPEEVYPIINGVVDKLLYFDSLNEYRNRVTGNYHIALDGTETYSSYNIHCKNCSHSTKSDKTRYHHSVVTPIFVSPDQKQVIPLAPEFVTPQDGHEKQDCELNASKRWLTRDGDRYFPLGITIQGDDLYCHEPFCRQMIESGGDFLFVCKESSHQTLYEWLGELANIENGIQHLTVTEGKGKNQLTHHYRYANDLPLNAQSDALLVNWCEWTITNAQGKTVYFNSWASSHRIDMSNVAELCRVARCRWKIENENNNNLKTKGYNFEHNYGHGQKYLANTLSTLIILAYLIHIVLNIMDHYFQALLDELPSRRTCFEHIRALLHYFPFNSWDELMRFMAVKNEIRLDSS